MFRCFCTVIIPGHKKIGRGVVSDKTGATRKPRNQRQDDLGTPRPPIFWRLKFFIIGGIMKKLLSFIFAICICSVANAATETMNWYSDSQLYSTTTCESGGDITLPQTPTKYGYTFQGWRVQYTQVEYLESTGTQWIDTGIYVNSSTKIEIKGKQVAKSIAFFGVSGALVFFNVEGPIAATFLGQTTYIQNKSIVGTIATIVMSKDGGAYLNGTRLVNPFNSTTLTSSNYPITLFTRINNNSGIENNMIGGTIYYCKIWDNGILVRDFIPALDSTGVPCLFDTVTQQFFYNSGTGNFTAGPAV